MLVQYHEDVSIQQVVNLQHSQEDLQGQYKVKNRYLEIHCRHKVHPFQYKLQWFFKFFLGLDLLEFYNIDFAHQVPHILDYRLDQIRCYLLVHSRPSSASFADTVLASYTKHRINPPPSFIDIAITIHKVVVDKPAIILDSSHLDLLACHLHRQEPFASITTTSRSIASTLL